MRPRAALKKTVAEPERDNRRKLELVGRPERKETPREQAGLLLKELQCCDRATD